MNTRKITPGCLCIVVNHADSYLNGLMCTAVKFIGNATCRCGCGWQTSDAWIIKLCQPLYDRQTQQYFTDARMQGSCLLPIPGDMPPPESLQHRKPVPALIEDEERKR